MKITYKNFIIEEDTYWYVLSEMGVKWDKAKESEIGKEYMVNQVYPATLEKAILSMLKRIKTSKQETIDLKDFIEVTKRIDTEFLNDLRTLIK